MDHCCYVFSIQPNSGNPTNPFISFLFRFLLLVPNVHDIHPNKANFFELTIMTLNSRSIIYIYIYIYFFFKIWDRYHTLVFSLNFGPCLCEVSSMTLKFRSSMILTRNFYNCTCGVTIMLRMCGGKINNFKRLKLRYNKFSN